MKRKRLWLVPIIAVAVLLTGAGGYLAFARREIQADATVTPVLQTATVTTGDIVITVDGSGELVPAAELEVAFRTSGVLAELLVEVGDHVQKGDLLARLATDGLERAAKEAETQVQIAQLQLADVQAGPSEAELADAETALRAAQVQLTLAQEAYNATFDSQTDGVIESRKVQFDWWVGYYQQQKAEYEQGRLSRADHDWAMAAMIAAEGEWKKAINNALAEEANALAAITQAKNAIYQAQQNLELVASQPLTDTLADATLAVDQALLAREQAATDLQAAQLYAPFSGTVMDIAAEVGEQVGESATILTLADLDAPLVHLWVEEADLAKVAVGYRVNIVFTARDDLSFTGIITRVSPVLTTVDFTSAVEAWASLDGDMRETGLLSGMTGEVEIVAAEARGALVVPVEALREVAPGQYAVLVVAADGQTEQRGVAVGLTDAVNAEILDGLELGEILSVGESE